MLHASRLPRRSFPTITSHFCFARDLAHRLQSELTHAHPLNEISLEQFLPRYPPSYADVLLHAVAQLKLWPHHSRQPSLPPVRGVRANPRASTLNRQAQSLLLVSPGSHSRVAVCLQIQVPLASWSHYGCRVRYLPSRFLFPLNHEGERTHPLEYSPDFPKVEPSRLFHRISRAASHIALHLIRLYKATESLPLHPPLLLHLYLAACPHHLPECFLCAPPRSHSA